MRNIGQKLQETRKAKGLTVKQLEKETKIKADFIKAIEMNDWEKLPEYPVLQGFIKNIAATLRLDVNQTIALLRRDYPPKKLKVNPTPDIKNKFYWGPRSTFLTALIVIAVLVLSYLGLQYYQFTQPPTLNVIRPEQGQEVFDIDLLVEGRTDPEATLIINNQPTLVSEDGSFSTKINISSQTSEVVVEATTRSDKKTVVVREIIPVSEQ